MKSNMVYLDDESYQILSNIRHELTTERKMNARYSDAVRELAKRAGVLK